MIQLPTTLHEAKIDALPSSAYYIPNFISSDEEAAILNKVTSAPRPRWKHLTHRRLQAWPSELMQDRLLDAPLPAWLEDPIIPRIRSIPMSDSDTSRLFDESPHTQPNHVLINEYPPGVGIMPHKVGASLRLHDSPVSSKCSLIVGWRRVLASRVHCQSGSKPLSESVSQ